MGSINKRKADHLEICGSSELYQVESRQTAAFDQLSFVHQALTTLNYDSISTETSFLGTKISFPFLISSMTGGSSNGLSINKNLAEIAQEMKIPLCLGSIRVVFSDDAAIKDFQVKAQAPNVPVLANLGAVQSGTIPLDDLQEMLKRLEVQGLIIHLNPGQELAQPSGDRDFSSVLENIEKIKNSIELPVVVKETGFGLSPDSVKKLLAMGVDLIDLAGSGGTNWLVVDSYRFADSQNYGETFRDWGLPTAIILDALDKHPGKIIASGGLRNGVDLAKALSLGASFGGMALPILRVLQNGGRDKLLDYLISFKKEFKTAMLLSNSNNLHTLANKPLLKTENFKHQVKTLKDSGE